MQQIPFASCKLTVLNSISFVSKGFSAYVGVFFFGSLRVVRTTQTRASVTLWRLMKIRARQSLYVASFFVFHGAYTSLLLSGIPTSENDKK